MFCYFSPTLFAVFSHFPTIRVDRRPDFREKKKRSRKTRKRSKGDITNFELNNKETGNNKNKLVFLKTKKNLAKNIKT